MSIEEISKEMDIFWEKYRVSSKPKLWKFDLKARHDLYILIKELVREHKKESVQYLSKIGIMCFDHLTPREQKVLEERFLNLKSYLEIARFFEVTRERIRQIELKAIDKLKAVRSLTNKQNSE